LRRAGPELRNVDILAEIKDVRAPQLRTFTVDLSGGRLTLDFDPLKGEAIVPNIRISRQD
jgi:hypothetical protein